jgi:hypothetical protein
LPNPILSELSRDAKKGLFRAIILEPQAENENGDVQT